QDSGYSVFVGFFTSKKHVLIFIYKFKKKMKNFER
ncbi:MAG: hypothetical protein ACI8RD_007329, partial [Bacillariaceae sp.]